MKTNNFKKIRTIIFILVVTTILSMLPVSSAVVLPTEEDEPIISSRLENEMDNVSSSAKIDVNLWFNDNSQREIFIRMTKELGMTEAEWRASISDDTPIEEIHEFKRLKAQICSEVYAKNNAELAKKYLETDEVTYISKYSPSILASMSATKIRELATTCNDILNIDLFEDDMEECSLNEYNTLEEFVAKITDLKTNYDYTGDGINVGIFDGGFPDASNIPVCNIIDYYDKPTDILSSSHAELVSRIIIEIAPDANYYFSGLTNGKTYYESIEWMIGNAVDVINMSLGDGAATSTYTSVSRWYDHISYQHYITFVTSVGNITENEITGQYEVGLVKEAKMAYNPIAVGGIDNKGTKEYCDDELGGTIYSKVTTFNVPFKPDICAPYGDSSQSAALITGVVTLLMGEQRNLTVYPEAIKAILTACVNTESPYRFLPKDRSTNENIASYMQFGAGLVDAYLTLACATSGNYARGLMLPSETMKTHTFTVTNTDPVRISLAFLQPVEIVGDDNHLSTSYFSNYNKLDLDLVIRNGAMTTQYCNSSTSANNIEIVTFNPPAPGTYTIQISRYGTQSADSDAWYGVAWHQE